MAELDHALDGLSHRLEQFTSIEGVLEFLGDLLANGIGGFFEGMDSAVDQVTHLMEEARRGPVGGAADR